MNIQGFRPVMAAPVRKAAPLFGNEPAAVVEPVKEKETAPVVVKKKVSGLYAKALGAIGAAGSSGTALGGLLDMSSKGVFDNMASYIVVPIWTAGLTAALVLGTILGKKLGGKLDK